jgi:DNA-directed RNA polymerase specialized sigma24 family protein
MRKWFSAMLPRISTSSSVDLNVKDLFEGLQKEEHHAIRVLYNRIAGFVRKLGHQYRLTPEEVEELTGDCVTILLLKIRTGQYVFQGYDPASFAIEIAKKKVRHYVKKQTILWEDHYAGTEASEPGTREDIEALTLLLAQLPEHCQKLIRLKYLEEIRDKDAIEQNLTQYSTVDALKNHRAKCMKKLSALAEQYVKNKKQF